MPVDNFKTEFLEPITIVPPLTFPVQPVPPIAALPAFMYGRRRVITMASDLKKAALMALAVTLSVAAGVVIAKIGILALVKVGVPLFTSVRIGIIVGAIVALTLAGLLTLLLILRAQEEALKKLNIKNEAILKNEGVKNLCHASDLV